MESQNFFGQLNDLKTFLKVQKTPFLGAKIGNRWEAKKEEEKEEEEKEKEEKEEEDSDFAEASKEEKGKIRKLAFQRIFFVARSMQKSNLQ